MNKSPGLRAAKDGVTRMYSSVGRGEGGKACEGRWQRVRAERGGPVVVKDQAWIVGEDMLEGESVRAGLRLGDVVGEEKSDSRAVDKGAGVSSRLARHLYCKRADDAAPRQHEVAISTSAPCQGPLCIQPQNGPPRKLAWTRLDASDFVW